MSKFSRLDNTKVNRMHMNAFKSASSSLSVSLIGNLAVAILFLTTHLASLAQYLDVRSEIFATRGNPTSAVSTRDGRFVFVSVTNVDQPDFPGPDSAAGSRTDSVSGIEVFRRDSSTTKIKSIGFVRTGKGSGAFTPAFIRIRRNRAGRNATFHERSIPCSCKVKSLR